MRDHVFIGSSPAAESCVQIGSPDYYELSRLELARFKEAIIQKLGPPPEGASLGIKEGEVVCFYDTENDKAILYAGNCETDAPETWAEVNMKAPRLDDPEFRESELIAVPEKGVEFGGPPGTCELCQKPIKNEFFDAVTKEGSPGCGSWASMCPACFRGVSAEANQGSKRERRS